MTLNKAEDLAIFWFRRDLRLADNAGLYHALKNHKQVLPVFIFDTEILGQLQNKEDKRVDFIHQVLLSLQKELTDLGSSLLVLEGKPIDIYQKLLTEYQLSAVYTNHDYEPYANDRDEAVGNLLKKHGVDFKTFKDQVIFERNEVVKNDGSPYTVFTPYSNRWKSLLSDFYLKPYPTKRYLKNLIQLQPFTTPSLKVIGFEKTGFEFHPPKTDDTIITEYKEKRDYPAIAGTTRLSLHLRFGTISIRELATKANELSGTWLNELIWREFYMMILHHFPHVVTGSFKKQYDNIKWRNNEEEFKAWCSGKTGYPIVDAGMRELNTTGFMHNRVRMITASFLTKHLLIDWSWGEAYFAEKLLDYDLSANNGGWQWAAGSGCDAAPYFRIFNPYEQTKKFDSELKYIRKWVPEFQEFSYPQPIVDHKFARERVLKVYKNALDKE